MDKVSEFIILYVPNNVLAWSNILNIIVSGSKILQIYLSRCIFALKKPVTVFILYICIRWLRKYGCLNIYIAHVN